VLVDALRVKAGSAAGLASRETVGKLPGSASSHESAHQVADQELAGFVNELAAAQELLYASDTASVLVILQGLDAAGKDGTIKHVMSGVNPQGCEVTSFKEPSVDELHHDFLWRVERSLPARGHIGIFNRSHYEDVLVVRVHPEMLAALHLPGLNLAADPGQPGAAGAAVRASVPASLWRQRYEDISAFEHHLHRNGTRIVKFFLHISKEEQRRRLLARLDDPSKHWKFSSSDLAERQYWDDYQMAYEAALSATSTDWAPWYVIPSDDKHVARTLVAGILAGAIEDLDLAMPEVSPETRHEILAAKAQLLAE
jgi:PPK2 family polyphosphate:nucleotide phosphotransferase